MPATPFYAALLAFLYLLLCFRIFGYRRRSGISLGAGSDAELERRVRVHGNFAEYVPFSLLLILLLEMQGVSGLIPHGLGIALVAARVMHAIAITSVPQILALRIAGIGLNVAVILVAALGNLWLSIA